MTGFSLTRRKGAPDPGGAPRRTLTWTTAACLVILALLGSAAEPWLSLALAAPSAGLAASFTWSLHDDPARMARLPHPAVAGAWASLLPAAVVGSTFLWPGVAAVAAVLTVAALGGTARIALRRRRRGGRATTHAPVEQVTGTLEDLLRMLPIDMLCDEWCSAAGCAETPGDDSPARAQLRRLVLGELRRRDLPGTLRWQTEAPWGTPDRYVRERRDRTA